MWHGPTMARATMRAVIVQHEHHEDEGLFGPALRRCGFAFERRLRTVRPSDATADLLVVLGGSMSAAALQTHPFLAAELALLAERLALGLPCLGICLGAQLLARAAGARVVRGEHGIELGALPVTWNAAGLADPALGLREPTMVVAHWHEDTFTPVPGAVPLASSARYEQQAFRIGSSYAFQFHLELDAGAFARWLGSASDEPNPGHDQRALSAGDGERAALVGRLAQWFASIRRP